MCLTPVKCNELVLEHNAGTITYVLGHRNKKKQMVEPGHYGKGRALIEMLPVDSRLNWVEVLCGRADGGTGEREVTVASISE